MILEDLERYLNEDDEFDYYNVGFDVKLNDIEIPNGGMEKFKEEFYGDMEGSVGVFEDVRSIIYDDILSVTGILKLSSDTSYDTYEKSPGEIALDIYNEALMTAFSTSISDVDVVFNDETEKF